MRCMARNKQTFFYAPRTKGEALKDEYGNRTGEYAVVIGCPVQTAGNISPATGQTLAEAFGVSVDYDKVILLDDPETLIDEYAILWVDTLPEINADGTTRTPHDYIVKRVARSLNSTALAIKKVMVGG